MNFRICTLGCKVNTYESNVMRDKLLNAGYIESTTDVADIYIINTCTVTDTSAHKSLKVVRQCIRKNEKAIIVVCGCMTQVEPEKAKIDGVSIILGNKYKSMIVEVLDQYRKTLIPIIQVEDIMECPFEHMVLNNAKWFGKRFWLYKQCHRQPYRHEQSRKCVCYSGYDQLFLQQPQRSYRCSFQSEQCL